MRKSLKQILLDESKPLLCDGAMGTQLIARGLRMGSCAEQWNIERPDDVRAIHLAYVAAGCDLITTNTFGGTPLALARHGLSNADEINRAGVRLAREAAATTGEYVLGDIGPIGELLEPYGEISLSAARDSFRKQAESLLQGGADALLIETMADPDEMAIALQACREVGGKETILIATATFGRAVAGEYRTMMGSSPLDCVTAASKAGANVVGCNCGTALTPDDYVSLATAFVQASAGKAPVIVQPNAGAPHEREGQVSYDSTAQAMAELTKRLRATGVQVVGGCCGTSPDHLRAMRSAVL